MTRKLRLSTGMAGIWLCALSQMAMAQAPDQANAAADAEANASLIGEIVVTARRFEESLQTTPVAVTALGGEALDRAQVTDITDLQRTVPSLAVSSGSASTSGFTFVAIRGQGNLTPVIANDPAVGTYIDGVYISRPSQGVFDLQDLQRVEVLRGPQGTLFGRNTTGGAINIITKDPSSEFEGEAWAGLGNYQMRNAGATVNVPLTDQLAGRITYNYRSRDGYGKNPLLPRDPWDIESHFVRGKVKFTGDALTVVISGDYNKITDNGQLVTTGAVNAGFALFQPPSPLSAFLPLLNSSLHRRDAWHTTYAGGVSISPAIAAFVAGLPADKQKFYSRTEPYDTLEAFGLSGTASLDLGAFTLKSISAFRYMKARGLVDTDGSPAPILLSPGGSKSETYSQEVQLSGKVIDDLSFIVGGYYGIEKGNEFSMTQLFGGLLRFSFADAKNTSKGLFGQLYYDITPSFRAVAGYRYTWDGRETVLRNRQIAGAPANQPVAGTPTGINCTVPAPDSPPTAENCAQTQKRDFSYPAWMAGLDWQASDDLFLYAKASAAVKAGGWNIRAGSLPSFEPEKVNDVEFGIKTDLLDRRLRANIAVFHLWKKGNQATVSSVLPGIGLTQYIQNNGDVRIWGAEFELVARPWEGMELNGNLSLMDGKYKKGSFSETQQVGSTVALPGCTTGSPTVQFCTADLSGLPIIQLPKTQFSVGATQTVPFGDGAFSFHADYSYVGSQYYNAVKAANQQPQAIKDLYALETRLGRNRGYGLLNGIIAYEFEQPSIRLSVFAKNIANNKYLRRVYSDLYRQLGFVSHYPGEPRTWGIELKYKF